MPAQIHVVGGGHVGRVLAETLDERPLDVAFVDDDSTVVRKARRSGLSAATATLTDPQELRQADVDRARAAIVATPRDSTNLLVVQHLRTRFGVEQVAVLVNDPQNHDAYESLDVDVLCGSTTLASALAELLAGVEEGGRHPAGRRSIESVADRAEDATDDRRREGAAGPTRDGRCPESARR